MADANNKRDYHIFEEFVYRFVADARKCRAADIFKLIGDVYAFNSTTIELCLETFKWTIFRNHQRKGGIKDNHFGTQYAFLFFFAKIGCAENPELCGRN